MNARCSKLLHGRFYVFITIDERSMVYELDAKTATGAGLSTCAPVLESVAP